MRIQTPKKQRKPVCYQRYNIIVLTHEVLVALHLAAELARGENVLHGEGEGSRGHAGAQEPPPSLLEAQPRILRGRVRVAAVLVLVTVVVVVVDALVVVVVVPRLRRVLGLKLDVLGPGCGGDGLGGGCGGRELVSEQRLVDEAEAALLHLLEAEEAEGGGVELKLRHTTRAPARSLARASVLELLTGTRRHWRPRPRG